MTEHSLSVVQLCPDVHKSAANATAEYYGFGPGNLNRLLLDTQGGVWWGCHAWWRPDVLAAVAPAPGVQGSAEALAAVITSAVTTDSAYEHWMQVLASHGLVEVVSDDG